MHSMIKEPETRDPLKEALDEVAKSDVNKRKILIPSEDDEDDPERKKLHLSTAGDDQKVEESEVRRSRADRLARQPLLSGRSFI